MRLSFAFRVEYAARAEGDIHEAASYLRRDSPEAARRWLAELRTRIERLQDSPEAFALIPESKSLGRPYRAIHHYSHRIIYRVDAQSDAVLIVRVYHGSRRPLSGGEIERGTAEAVSPVGVGSPRARAGPWLARGHPTPTGKEEFPAAGPFPSSSYFAFASREFTAFQSICKSQLSMYFARAVCTSRK